MNSHVAETISLNTTIHEQQSTESDVGLNQNSFSFILLAISVWLFVVIITLCKVPIYLLGGIAAITGSLFAFLLPSMIYFRVGVVSDFATIPICGILPNRLYMSIMQGIGLILVLGNLLEIITFIMYEA